MGMTMTEKILARTAGKKTVSPGDILFCKIDRMIEMEHVTESAEDWMPERVFDPERMALTIDHQAPPPTLWSAQSCRTAREYVKKTGIKHFFDLGRGGVTHQVAAENGFCLPGTLLLNPDSHTCAVGAYNCAGRGVGRLQALYGACKGEVWYKLGPTIKFVVKGKLPDMVMARDVFHYIAKQHKSVEDRNLEFVGPTIEAMSIAGRQCISTMCAEINAEFVLFEADDKTKEYLKGRTKEKYTPVKSDPDAKFEAVYEIDVSKLEPQVAAPTTVTNVKSVKEVEGTKIDQALLGTCANGRLEDLEIAARIVKGKKVHPDCRFIIIPASQEVFREAVRLGYVQTLTDADAMVTPATCGPCMGNHMGIIADGDVCISSNTRNFKGRMGGANAEIYLASPATIAASAIEGVITDPRKLA